MNRVELTPSEAQWFSRNVINSLKIMDGASSKDPSIKERTTYKTLFKIKEQAEALTHPDNPLRVMLSKKQKNIIYDMIGNTVRVLEERIIPEYAKRGEKFKSYESNAKEKVTLLKSMQRKFR